MKYDYELKILPEYFEPVAAGKKTFEIRYTLDRTFRIGDRILLEEWNKEQNKLTGRYVVIEVMYITDYNQAPSQIVFSFRMITDLFNPHMDYDKDYKKLKIV